MSVSTISKPHERLAEMLAGEMAAVNTLIRTRMASEHAPRIPEVTAHLVEAGGKRLRPMLTLAAAQLFGYSGDHHVHAAGCAHYDSPTEGVGPEDMMRHILGEDLNVGCVLSWGPCWYTQKAFFEGLPVYDPSGC